MLQKLIKLSNLCNFQGNISHQKLRNCWVAKKSMSHSFPVKFRVFGKEFLRNHSVYWAQSLRDNWNCYALSIFWDFFLLASSDSDKHMLMLTASSLSFSSDLVREFHAHANVERRSREKWETRAAFPVSRLRSRALLFACLAIGRFVRRTKKRETAHCLKLMRQKV